MTAPRILFVDDESDFETLVRQHFRKEIKSGDYHFTFARDGVDALDIISREPDIDVVFSDINMPRMDGLSLLRTLMEKADRPTTVIVSAYGDMKNIRTAMNSGAFDFITKPIAFEDLDATLLKSIRHVSRLKELSDEKASAQRAEAMLSRYFSPDVVNAMRVDPTQIEARNARREATFLFTDLQDFLALVEASEPADIVSLLNEYLDGLTRTIFEHDGTVLKILGDSVYAIFGAPLDNPDHADNAIACAQAIDRFAESLRKRKTTEGMSLGQTRIGIHTGWAIVGSFGGDMFFDYAAYGGAVNIASRLEQANKVLGTRICVSKATVSLAKSFRGRAVGNLRLKGSESLQTCFEPVSPESMDDDRLSAYEDAFAQLVANDPAAKAGLAALIGGDPDDALVSFHLARLLTGNWSPDITIG